MLIICTRLIISNEVILFRRWCLAIARVTIRAIHDTDLVKVLKKLGLYEGVVEGRYKCFVCGRKITLENIGGLFKSRDGKINFECNNMRCLMIAAEITSKINSRI